MPSAVDTLPSHLNFEQLRKQAKDLLKERKAAGAPLQLKEAQRKLAQRYGFKTWAELKARAEGNERVIALKNAIDRDDVEGVRKLLTEDPSLHRAPLGYNNNGPLTWAAECRGAATVTPERMAMVRMMVELGSDIHQGGDGPLMRASLNSSRFKLMELLIELGADVNALWNGTYPIILGPCECLAPEVLEFLLKRGANPNVSSPSYGNALEMVIGTYDRKPQAQHACAELLVRAGAKSKFDGLPSLDIHRGRLDLLEEKLKRDPQLVHKRFPEFTYGGTGYRRQDLKGGTLLHVAAEYGEAEAAKLLLKYGADVNARADGQTGMSAPPMDGPTPIFYAATQYWDSGLEVTRVLLDAGADLSIKARVAGHYERPDEFFHVTPLGYAARFPFGGNASPKTLALLIERKAAAGDIYAAARAGYADELAALIASGADVNVKGGDGDSAISAALAGGRKDLAEMLLKAGARPSFIDSCALGRVDEVRAALEQNRKLVEEKVGEFGWTAVHHAAARNQPDVLAVLHRYGASLNLRDGRHGTPLHRAVEARAIDAVRWLLDHNVPVDTPEWTGRTALFIAAEMKAPKELIDLLLARGADTKVKIGGKALNELLA
ncbi:MAG TPA: ankyrin repeat domain-containing protein [Planctomycetota bacterium]|nr:ankyrin repeat domain-containing protein [Planctomycetota bacterium]